MSPASAAPIAAYHQFFDALDEPATINRAIRDDAGTIVDWLIAKPQTGRRSCILGWQAPRVGTPRSCWRPPRAPRASRPLRACSRTWRLARTSAASTADSSSAASLALGSDCWAEVYRDVTSERLEGAALRDRKSRSFSFEWMPATDQVRRSANCSSLFGLEGRAAVEDTGQQFFQRVHPDDRQRFLAVLHALRPDHDRYETTYRIVKPDGSATFVEECAQASFDESGALTRAGRNHHRHHRALEAAERAVRDSEARLSVAKEAAGLGIHDFDVVSGTVSWDARVRDLFGVPAERTITYQTFIDGVHPDRGRPTPTRWFVARSTPRATAVAAWVPLSAPERRDRALDRSDRPGVLRERPGRATGRRRPGHHRTETERGGAGRSGPPKGRVPGDVVARTAQPAGTGSASRCRCSAEPMSDAAVRAVRGRSIDQVTHLTRLVDDLLDVSAHHAGQDRAEAPAGRARRGASGRRRGRVSGDRRGALTVSP